MWGKLAQESANRDKVSQAFGADVVKRPIPDPQFKRICMEM